MVSWPCGWTVDDDAVGTACWSRPILGLVLPVDSCMSGARLGGVSGLTLRSPV